MTGASNVVRYAAFAVIALFSLVFGLFAAGYAFEDPGGWAAAGLTALWLGPVVALSLVALRYPAQAGPLFVGVTAVGAVLTLVDSAFGIVPRDEWGPVLAITVFATGVALAFLGLRRAKLAGLLLLTLGVCQLAATVLGFAAELTAGEGPGLGDMLTTSSGVVVMPILVGGLLFLLAGSLAHESWHGGQAFEVGGPRASA
jgi:hypothetical protein